VRVEPGSGGAGVLDWGVAAAAGGGGSGVGGGGGGGVGVGGGGGIAVWYTVGRAGPFELTLVAAASEEVWRVAGRCVAGGAVLARCALLPGAETTLAAGEAGVARVALADEAGNAVSRHGEGDVALLAHATGPGRMTAEVTATATKKFASREIRVWHGATEKGPWTMDESKTPPTHLGSCRYLTLCRGVFGFVYHSIAILIHEVPLSHDSQLLHRCRCSRDPTACSRCVPLRIALTGLRR
jgi:hypothetical protein